MNTQNSEVRSQKSARARSEAFTLVELMVAIALVLILMLGVSKVFSTASQTISANQGISDHTRDARAAQSILADDFLHAVTQDAPYMIIHGETRAAFRNAADLQSDRDYTTAGTQTVRDNQVRSIDLDGNNVEGDAAVLGEISRPAIYDHRNHRVDICAFFARGLFHRQTGGTVASGGGTPFIAPMTTSEALIWLGHLRIANNAGALTGAQDPGMGTFAGNQNNFYASDWVLGHQMILLQEPNAAGNVVDSNNAPQIFFPTTASALSPLQYDSGDGNAVGNTAGTFEIQNCRYDIAGTSISSFRQKMITYTNNSANDPPAGTTWWSSLMGSGGSRFQVNPAINKPITPTTFSQQSPLFMRGCSQFIVEYAGDYLKQNTDSTDIDAAGNGNAAGIYGAVQDTYARYDPAITNDPVTNAPLNPRYSTKQWVPGTTDGQIDFIIVNGRKQIRWYGMPRDTNGNGAITLGEGDVCPLRDSWQNSINATLPQTEYWAPFEKHPGSTAIPNGTITKKANYAAAGTNGMASTADYMCAWGPNDPKPRMIRITLVLDDPNARTQDGQMFEYVFELP